MIRLLIVEDEPFFRQLLVRSLSSETELEVVGAADNGRDAIRLAAELHPDAVLMDVELSDQMDGITAALEIRKVRPQTGIVILSAYSDRQYLINLPVSDLRGWSYLLKKTVPNVATLLRAIQGSAAGLVMMDPSLVANWKPREGTSIAGLTPRQREVLELIAQGYNNAAIGTKLAITEKSVETYINAIYQELHLVGGNGTHARVKAALRFLEETAWSR